MTYPIHPAANIYPPMTDDEYEALLADIATHGQRQPIVLYQGSILDGRHRYRACEELGIDAAVTHYEGGDPLAYVLSAHNRRSLTTTQRACVALGVKRLIQQDGNSTMSGTARDIAGQSQGVSGSLVDKVAAVEREAPALFEAMWSGGLSVWDAERQLQAHDDNKAVEALVAPANDAEIIKFMQTVTIKDLRSKLRKADKQQEDTTRWQAAIERVGALCEGWGRC